MARFYVALKAIVVKDNVILAIKRSSKEEVYTGLWDIPGGRMAFGEEPQQCLKREVREETGLEIEVLRPYNVWSFNADSETQVIGITFECLYKSGKIKLSKEHTDYKWIDPKGFRDLNADRNLKKEIARFSIERIRRTNL